jgi:hypothetical protein
MSTLGNRHAYLWRVMQVVKRIDYM